MSIRISEKLNIISIKLYEGKTKPPNRLTEARLLKLMEENGIGTDATRATYPKLIIDSVMPSRRAKCLSQPSL